MLSTLKHVSRIRNEQIPARSFLSLLLLLPVLLSLPGHASQPTTLSGFPGNFSVTVEPVPGGIAAIDIGPERLPTPAVHWNKKQIWVQKSGGRWIALVGIPLKTKPGSYTLSVFSTVARKSVFKVFPKRYPLQKLVILDSSKVTPPAAALQRIGVEREKMRHARSSWRAGFDAGAFQLPLEGRWSSPFGLNRLYNGKAGNRHSGLDIAAPTGTPVFSPAAGRVIEVGDFYFNGLTVFVDHGQGLVSLYSHLSATDVSTGDTVEPGQALGKVGATGRVTGPHLHWSVGLNGVWVNPELFLTSGQ